jgi:hypothetical protein
MTQDDILDQIERRLVGVLLRLIRKSHEGMSSKQAVDFVLRQVARMEETRKKLHDAEGGNDEGAEPEETTQDQADNSDIESVDSDDVRDDEQAGSLARAKSLVSEACRGQSTPVLLSSFIEPLFRLAESNLRSTRRHRQ